MTNGRLVCLLAAVWMIACGDNIPLAPRRDLVIVAHQDDDLLFMQPDLSDTVRNHQPATIVYVTAGDGGAGLAYADSRITAIKAAYGWIAGSQDWQCAWIAIAHHAVQRCELPVAHLDLLYLGYPDGGIPGSSPNSLLHLFQGDIPGADTVADRVAHYDRDGLIATLAEIITLSQPRVIRTLEVAAAHGYDHSDHMLVGTLAVLAAARAGSAASMLAYRGYNVNFEPVNLPDALFDRVSLGMRAYEACQVNCARCVDQVCTSIPLDWYNAMLHRRYAVAMRQGAMTGLLQLHGQCLAVRGSRVVLDDCAEGTPLTFDGAGRIHAGDRCLRVGAEGRLTARACHDSPASYFLFDEEGHLWSGVPPSAQPNMIIDHTMCVTTDLRGDVRAGLCGARHDTRWVLGQVPGATLRAGLGLPADDRAIQLADVTGDGDADLCWVAGGSLRCAPGIGDGGFSPAVRIDAAASPLAIEPESLMLGDVDGDGAIDACGRTASGILCATAASGFAARAWTTGFAGTGGAAPDDRSLAIVGREICGSGASGVACTGRDAPAVVRSRWTTRGAPVWSADLDGDGAPDWCEATPSGPACGLAADRDVTTDGLPWGFASNTKIEGSVARDGAMTDRVHGALADISGDGLADLCTVIGDRVECALSQGHGFGPRFPVLSLGIGSTAHALWLGDLDGDGKADACVDDGNEILCARSP